MLEISAIAGPGRSLGVPLPATALTEEMLAAARGLGLAEHDFAVVFDVLAGLSGLGPSARATPLTGGA